MKLGRDVERLSGGRLGSGRIPNADGVVMAPNPNQGYLFIIIVGLFFSTYYVRFFFFGSVNFVFAC